MADPKITVTSGHDRPSQQRQIEAVLVRARAKDDTLRIRLPFTLYDYTDSRGYTLIRDAAWNLQLPAADTSPEMVMRLIETIGKCVVAIATHGSDAVEDALRGMGDSE